MEQCVAEMKRYSVAVRAEGMTVMDRTKADGDAALVEALRREDPEATGAPGGDLRRSRVPARPAHHGIERGRRGSGAGRAVDGGAQDLDLQGRGRFRQLALPHRGQRRVPEAARPQGARRTRSRWTTLLPAFDDAGRHFEPMADWSDRVDEQALQGELRQVLGAAIDELPPDYRTALVMHDVEGLSNPDIAEALGHQPARGEVARAPLAPLRAQAARRVHEDRDRRGTGVRAASRRVPRRPRRAMDRMCAASRRRAAPPAEARLDCAQLAVLEGARRSRRHTKKGLSMEAVIATGGKQYRVAPGQVISIEKVPGEKGSAVEFRSVLLVTRDGEVIAGREGAQRGEGVRRGRGPGPPPEGRPS